MQTGHEKETAFSAHRILIELNKSILKTWDCNKINLTNEMKLRMDSGDIYVLYDAQVLTSNLLRYSFQTREYAILDDLARYYLTATPYLKLDADCGLKWIYCDSNNKELHYLFNNEIPLISSQFLFVVAEMINDITQLNESEVAESMKQLVREYMPVITDFYDRLRPMLFEWMMTALNAAFPPVDDAFSFSVPVRDDLLFVLGGMAHLLGTRENVPETVGLTTEQTGNYRAFVALGSRLLEKRLTASTLQDFQGNAVEGLNFDLGVWDGFEDYAYTGYSGAAYPTEQEKGQAQDVGWDISHARRFVNAFDALYDNRHATGQSFPDESVMRRLANQVVYGTFNGDFEQPLFTNFMDGTNGWYRVGYAGREQFGYAPYMLSFSLPTGGYGLWSRFNADIGRLMAAIHAMLNKGLEESTPKQFIDQYYKDLTCLDSLGMLMFLPSMAAYCSCELPFCVPSGRTRCTGEKSC